MGEMASRLSPLTLVVVAVVFANFALGQSQIGVDDHNWIVGDCIMAKFNMTFKVTLNVTQKNETVFIHVPENATALTDQKECGNETQTLNLSWTDKASNSSHILLDRSITIVFARNLNDSFYGVQHMYGTFTMGVWKSNETVHNETVYNSTVSFDTLKSDKLMFHTPIDKSFTCKNLGNLLLPTTIKFNPKSPPVGRGLPDTTVLTNNLQFDAFRMATHKKPSGFRAAVDCTYHQPNDIVPIVVGSALSLLIVAVLVAYFVGRRRQQRRGYQSV